MTTLTDAQRETLAQRGATAGFPMIVLDGGVRVFEGERGWQRLTEPSRQFSSENVQDIERQLAAAERAKAAIDTARIPEPAPRDEAEVGPQETVDAARNAEVIRAGQYRQSTEGRLEAIENVLVEIRELLAARP